MWVYLSPPQWSIYILYIWKDVYKKSLHVVISLSLFFFFFFYCVCLSLKTASNQWFLSCKSPKIQANVVHTFSVTNRWCPPAQSFAGSRIVFEKSKCVTYREKVKLLSESAMRPTLCNPMDCSPLGSSVLGILQARILEWDAVTFSRESSQTQGSNLGLLHCRQNSLPSELSGKPTQEGFQHP